VRAPGYSFHMANYHHTDTLGQAVEQARQAVSAANDALGDLGAELIIEREMHRAEVARLVERAETAEQADAFNRAELVRLVLGVPDDVPVLPTWPELFAAVRELATERDDAERREH
jgi:hypothetical protein